MPSPSKTTQHAAADVFTAIAHPVRRQILDMLVPGEQTVGQLAEPFVQNQDMTRPAVSQHLGILLESGLVEREKRGREQYYRLRPENLNEVRDWLRRYEHFWSDKLDALGDYLNRLAGQEQSSDET